MPAQLYANTCPVVCISGDAAAAADTAALLAALGANGRPLSGILHAGAVLESRMLQNTALSGLRTEFSGECMCDWPTPHALGWPCLFPNHVDIFVPCAAPQARFTARSTFCSNLSMRHCRPCTCFPRWRPSAARLGRPAMQQPTECWMPGRTERRARAGRARRCSGAAGAAAAWRCAAPALCSAWSAWGWALVSAGTCFCVCGLRMHTPLRNGAGLLPSSVCDKLPCCTPPCVVEPDVGLGVMAGVLQHAASGAGLLQAVLVGECGVNRVAASSSCATVLLLLTLAWRTSICDCDHLLPQATSSFGTACCAQCLCH